MNAKFGGCFQGQTHGHKSFLVQTLDAKLLIARQPKYAEVLRPFLIADDLVGRIGSKPSRYVIDFSKIDLLSAQSYPELYKRLEIGALPARQAAVKKEAERNELLRASAPSARANAHHANFLRHWWRLSYERDDMMSKIGDKARYIVCGRITKRPIFEFVSTSVNPNDALIVFAHQDDYTFGVLQSGLHWTWFEERCSTMKSDPRYTSNTVFDSFPWPQEPSLAAIKAVAAAAVALREMRRELCLKHNIPLRDIYRSIELPGEHPLKTATARLDTAVRMAYGMDKDEGALDHLLSLNLQLAERERQGQEVRGPGLPSFVNDTEAFITDDCITA